MVWLIICLTQLYKIIYSSVDITNILYSPFHCYTINCYTYRIPFDICLICIIYLCFVSTRLHTFINCVQFVYIKTSFVKEGNLKTADVLVYVRVSVRPRSDLRDGWMDHSETHIVFPSILG